MAINVGDALLKVGADTKGLDRSMDKIQKNTKSTFEKMRRNIKLAGIALTGIFVAVGGLSIKAASDAEEMRSKFDVVFGDLADSTAAWADETSKAMSRSRFDFIEYLSILQDTFVPMGFARDKAAELSKSMVQLAVDVASFNNKAEPDVIRDFQSALVGNHETVRKYGIVITEATMKQEILNKGWAESEKEITNAMKVQARLNLIMAGTTDAQGDAIRTAGSFANQMKALSASMQDIKVSLGQALMPLVIQLVERIKPILSGLGEWVKNNQGLAKTILLAVGALGVLLLILPSLVSGIGALGTVIAVLSGPVGWIALAISAIIALGLAWKNNWGDIRGITADAINAIVKGVFWFVDKVIVGFQYLVKAVTWQLRLLAKGMAWLGDKLGIDLLKGLDDAIGGIDTKLEEFRTTVRENLGKAAEGVEDWTGSWQKAAEDVGNATHDIGDYFDEIADAAKETAKVVVDAAEEKAKAEEDAAKRIADANKTIAEKWEDMRREALFAMSTAGQLKLTWDDVMTAFIKKAGGGVDAVDKLQDLLTEAEVPVAYGDIQGALDAIGMSALEVGRLVGKGSEWDKFEQTTRDQATAVFQLKLTMEDVRDAFFATGGTLSEFRNILDANKIAADDVQGAISFLGLTANGVAEVVGKLKDKNEELTESFKKVAETGEDTANRLAKTFAKIARATGMSLAQTILGGEAFLARKLAERTAGGGTLSGFQHGGIIPEPTLLTSLRSMRPYAVAGEAGPERVVPGRDGGYQTANILVQLDGRTIAKVIGQPLIDMIRVKTGVRI